MLYHCTPKENIESILKFGLLRRKSAFIFLSSNPLSWYKSNMVVFEVDDSKLNKHKFTEDGNIDEILYWDDISPLVIKLYIMGS